MNVWLGGMEKGIGREDCTGTMIVKEEWKRRNNINKYM
jgi:hypothetical protein